MPTYVFQCKKCNKEQEILCEMRERKNQVCIKCKGELQRIFSPFAFRMGEGMMLRFPEDVDERRFYKSDEQFKRAKQAERDYIDGTDI